MMYKNLFFSLAIILQITSLGFCDECLTGYVEYEWSGIISDEEYIPPQSGIEYGDTLNIKMHIPDDHLPYEIDSFGSDYGLCWVEIQIGSISLFPMQYPYNSGHVTLRNDFEYQGIVYDELRFSFVLSQQQEFWGQYLSVDGGVYLPEFILDNEEDVVFQYPDSTSGFEIEGLALVSSAGPLADGTLHSLTVTHYPESEDVNADTIVDVVDLLQVVSAMGDCIGCEEDIDGDGTVDVSDLLLVINAWQ